MTNKIIFLAIKQQLISEQIEISQYFSSLQNKIKHLHRKTTNISTR